MAFVRRFGNKYYICKATGSAGRKGKMKGDDKPKNIFWIRAISNTFGLELNRVNFPKEHFGKKCRFIVDFVNSKNLNKDEQKIESLLKINKTLVKELESRDENLKKIAQLVGSDNFHEMVRLI